jgi:signal transduction histidine kinase
MNDKEKVNILLVDDQAAKLLSYEVILSDLGENLIKANSAREALEQLLRNEIAIVLTDVSMPDLDGFELAAMIREHPRYQRTAIIFISGIYLSDLDRLRGYQAGAVDYVPVPVVPELLRAKVRIFAELHRKTRELERLNAELEYRVQERTAELAQANAELERRVEERTRERELALAQLHEMQKMESLGQLTGGVAHDFNNLLMVILGNLSLLKRRLPDDPAIVRLLEGAVQGAERGAALTKRMLAFARRQELEPAAVNFTALVEGMHDMLQRTLGPTIRVSSAFAPELPLVHVDPNQLELVLLNLSLNARDAMPDGGHLRFSAQRELDPRAVSGLAPDGDYVCISVSDTGCGMDEETLNRATEPFFTTKGSGKGTGLGLSMVQGLVVQSGGAIRIESKLGQGTTINLWLPVASPAEQEIEPASDLGAAVHGPCRVLVVDDDPLIVASTAAMLEDAGHMVVESSSGQRALDVLRLGTQVDVVVTDHAMPGMTGLELARRIHQGSPSLPVILVSGYADLPASAEIQMPRLAKPYKQQDLLDLIARAMGGNQHLGNVISLAAASRR